MRIQQFVAENTERGECKCGQCADVGTSPDPTGQHTVDMCMFKVGLKGTPSREEFEALTKEHEGGYAQCNPFDGREHSYIELGAWIGDQGLALQYMGLGTLLGAFKLLSPITMLGLSPEKAEEKDLIMKAVQYGLLAVQKA